MRAVNLVTGGTGIVGAHVLLELLRAGDSVRALYREGSDRSIVQRIFRHYGHRELSDRIEWIEGDVMDVSALADLSPSHSPRADATARLALGFLTPRAAIRALWAASL